MTKYIESEDNLKVMMNLLRDKSKNIQFEAFHVFKVSLIPSPGCLPESTGALSSFAASDDGNDEELIMN